MAGVNNPWAKTVPLVARNTAYQLLALMQGVDSGAPDHCQAIQIQFWSQAGGAKLFVGNSDIVANGGGVELFATQAFGYQDVGGNRVDLKEIYLMSDTDTQYARITVLRM